MRFPKKNRLIFTVACLVGLTIGVRLAGGVEAPQTVTLRGHRQTLRVSGPSGGAPVVVSSGDGGWVHLGPHVAQLLASRGYRVLGFDVRAYLESFTSGSITLRPEDEPHDYVTLIDAATARQGRTAILIGVSEGAGLSVLAATDSVAKTRILGVVGLGLPDLNELGWRWKDSITYLTHQLPKEPTFSVAAIVAKMAPVPLAVIHSTHDEFVPLAEVERVLDQAAQPKRLWVINAADHRFSDNVAEFDQRLLESVVWIQANAPR